MDQLHQPSRLGIRTQGERENGDFQIFPDIVAVFRYADGGRFQGGQPEQLFNPLVDLALVGGGGGAVFHQ